MPLMALKVSIVCFCIEELPTDLSSLINYSMPLDDYVGSWRQVETDLAVEGLIESGIVVSICDKYAF